jgi:hypothetical protein
MAFKPGRKVEGEPDLDKLRTILNNTKLSSTNNPLYQFLNSLLNSINSILGFLLKKINDIETSTTTNNDNNIGHDYVVLSDGGIPTAQPINDGAGSFIYIQYEP